MGEQKIFRLLLRFSVPAVVGLLLLPLFFGLDGIWIATPVSTLGSSLITGAFLYYILRQLKDN